MTRLAYHVRDVCSRCHEPLTSDHQDEHPDLCCDCFSVALGKPIADVNARRKAQGRPPIPDA